MVINSINNNLDEEEILPVRRREDQEVVREISESNEGVFEPGKVQRKTTLKISGREIKITEIINHSQGRIPEGRLVRTRRQGQHLFLSISYLYQLHVYQVDFNNEENQEINNPTQEIDLEEEIKEFACLMYSIIGIEVEQNQEERNIFTFRISVKDKVDEITEKVILIGLRIQQDLSLTVIRIEVEGAGAVQNARNTERGV